MTKKDESPEEATNPYWSDELLAVLAEALGDEDRARQTLEGIIQQAQEGKAMRTLSTERLASHLTELYGRIAEGVQNSGVRPPAMPCTPHSPAYFLCSPAFPELHPGGRA